jgi:hypothetical protein
MANKRPRTIVFSLDADVPVLHPGEGSAAAPSLSIPPGPLSKTTAPPASDESPSAPKPASPIEPAVAMELVAVSLEPRLSVWVQTSTADGDGYAHSGVLWASAFIAARWYVAIWRGCCTALRCVATWHVFHRVVTLCIVSLHLVVVVLQDEVLHATRCNMLRSVASYCATT